ncbi:hypothetical protein MKW94_012614 [Papaver nudicaule]|uniref:Uncharacterized protein n=1 Tax=Papaver nudicaule TaxID=74823 RepID=A0AA42B4H9_PAPNU|nr:hypothetical protein [Papaver nudicaule]
MDIDCIPNNEDQSSHRDTSPNIPIVDDFIEQAEEFEFAEEMEVADEKEVVNAPAQPHRVGDTTTVPEIFEIMLGFVHFLCRLQVCATTAKQSYSFMKAVTFVV